ncbi:molybdopterin-binding protein [Algirhabdus cladophorae]|uniref:molybdopterin-binding protein n=1 Tax=Algirhabdus cladophorae TaxID=3377108 RepID=UPI003B8495C0
MKFGPCRVDQAKGAILAHSVSLPSGAIKKGSVLTEAHVEDLIKAGIASIVVACLAPTDLDENAAAAALGDGFSPASNGLRASAAHTGRVNLFAQIPGVIEIDKEAINAFNRVNPMITIATVPAHQRLVAGDMVATIKIIAYGVPKSDVDRAVDLAGGALTLRAPIFNNAVLIETLVADQSIGSKGYDALSRRLSRLDVSLGQQTTCDHTVDGLAAALMQTPAEVIFILTGSATSDTEDVGPSALRKAGGVVTYFGMPVDPGNLLFLGYLGHRPVIGLPGCARSVALNGADWVLERVLCGLPVGPEQIQAMGVGGLLKEIAQRGHPRNSKA